MGNNGIRFFLLQRIVGFRLSYLMADSPRGLCVAAIRWGRLNNIAPITFRYVRVAFSNLHVRISPRNRRAPKIALNIITIRILGEPFPGPLYIRRQSKDSVPHFQCDSTIPFPNPYVRITQVRFVRIAFANPNVRITYVRFVVTYVAR